MCVNMTDRSRTEELIENDNLAAAAVQRGGRDERTSMCLLRPSPSNLLAASRLEEQLRFALPLLCSPLSAHFHFLLRRLFHSLLLFQLQGDKQREDRRTVLIPIAQHRCVLKIKNNLTQN